MFHHHRHQVSDCADENTDADAMTGVPNRAVVEGKQTLTHTQNEWSVRMNSPRITIKPSYGNRHSGPAELRQTDPTVRVMDRAKKLNVQSQEFLFF